MLRVSTDRVRQWLPVAAWLLLATAIVALTLLALAGPSYRSGLMELSGAFGLFRYGAWTGLLVALLALPVAGLCLWLGRARQSLAVALIALLIGAISVGLPYSWLQKARSVPPIHDISTDTEDPPAFEAIAPLRADAPNPVAYAGEETARQQREAYPDLETMILNVDRNTAVEAAVHVAQSMRWILVDVDAPEGRIEATATTRWFGFKDDVVIRIRETTRGSELDIRSKSRVGRSDVGANAERIREFRDRLEARLLEDTP